MPGITCTCSPAGTIHCPSCPIGRLQLEMELRASTGMDAATGRVRMSSAFLERCAHEERMALRGLPYSRDYVRSEVERLAALRHPRPREAASKLNIDPAKAGTGSPPRRGRTPLPFAWKLAAYDGTLPWQRNRRG